MFEPVGWKPPEEVDAVKTSKPMPLKFVQDELFKP
jgi:hypothetical protein